MFISKLRISGFKSFSEDTTITINSGLNGIIGPNGSGKSNIVEAIKWVMGENSSKSLRGSALNDLIFSGSASKASKNIALVSMTLEVERNLLEDNYKKFTKDNIIQVERQVIRDSGSTYRINGKEVKAKDIQFLFADFSSGSRSSNIIDQGNIGNLVLQKPIERRRILDEAAGISGISARKNETTSKLEATRRNIDRLNDILSAKKKNLSELQKQAKKAKTYKETQREASELEEKLLIAKWLKTKNQIESLKSQISGINESLKNKNNQLINLENNKKNEESILISLNERKKDIKEKNLVLNLDIEKINFEINSKKNDLTSLKNLKIQIQKSIDFQREILENSKRRVIELNKETNLLLDKEKKLIKQSSTKKNLELSLSKIQELESKIKNTTLEFNEEKHLVTKFEFEKPVLLKNIDDTVNNISSIKNQIKQKQITKNKDSDYTKFTNIIERNKSSLKKLNFEKEETFKRIEYVKKNIDKLKLLTEKEGLFLEKQKTLVNEIEKEISNYLSLGYKTTKSNILKEIKIQDNYRLAFCLAIGDGIEAENDKNSSVQWAYLTSSNNSELPKGLESLNKYVKGPKKLERFLSQVAVVKNNIDGNKYQKYLKNGQIAVTKEGSLWRWDGLIIINGKKTFTYKRIESTTKILQLEKKLTLENKNLLLKNNNKVELDKKNKSYEDELNRLEIKISSLNQSCNEIQFVLNDADKELFVIKNTRKKLDEDIIDLKQQLLVLENNLISANSNLGKLENNISEKSSKVLQISKQLSDKKENLEHLKKDVDKWQISYALEKQENDTLILKNEKNKEEIRETNKKIAAIQETINTLNQDLKEAEEKIILIELNPSHSNNKIELLNKKINENNANLIKVSEDYNNIQIKYDEIKENLYSKKRNIDEFKEKSIRKDAQLQELFNFINEQEENIKNDFKIELDISKLQDINQYNLDIKETDSKLKKLKLKTNEFHDINFSAEKDASELEDEVNNLDIEEKDLTKAAKKLEKAIEELNKESRTRILNTFQQINITFSQLFKKLFSGGKAYLELVDSTDPLQAGLELMVSPPGKKLQKLSLLSGGEKALASLALIFSTFINKSSPICILDEVDAPLDEGNVEKFCELLKEATKITNNRFLVVTHNKITMSFMNKLYGITMLEPGSSKIVSVNLDDAESVYAAE